MTDFSSALYLGLRHPGASLAPWDALTTGRPAALQPPAGECPVAARLAALVGAEGALLAPSTLHLAWDLFDVLARAYGPLALFVDDGAYPVARWGVERAALRGAAVRRFPHLDVHALATRLAAVRGRRPVVVTDGFCPGCGRAAPIAAYQALVRAHGGLLVVDDTQALGILGRAPRAALPYGSGGGGTIAWSGGRWEATVIMASLAKSFGAPVAALAGGVELIAHFANHADTRVHCSPPSAAAIAALARALSVNAARGDVLRAQLATLVARFRAGAARAGIALTGGCFPVQSARLTASATGGADGARELHAALRARGTTAVLQRAHAGPGARLTFLITAAHRAADVDRAVDDLAAVLAVRHGRAAARWAHREALCG